PDSVQPRKPAGTDRFDVAFDAGDLSREEQMRIRFSGKRFVQYLGRVDESVAVDLSELEKLGVLQSGDQPQHAGLLAVPQVVLESDEPVGVRHQVFLAQLHARIWLLARLRMPQTLRLHRA